VLITMLLSLAGIPLTAGFIGKLAVLAVGVKAGQWWLVGGVVLASAIGVFYYLRVVNALLTASETVPERDAIVGGWGRRVSGAMLLLAMIATLWLGVFPESLFTMGRQLVFP